MTPPLMQLQPPDIRRWQAGNTGTAYVHRFDTARPGPAVLLLALTHGNELCGAIALDWLLSQLQQQHQQQALPLQQGSLTLVFANVAAFERFDPAAPHASRCIDEDLNRVWADAVLFGPGNSTELRRARELQPFIDGADLLLDMHSMSEPCRPLMVCGTLDKNAAYARQLGTPADLLIDTGHPAGLRLVERGGFGDPASPKRALLIECGQHWEAAAADVAIDVLVRFLQLTGLVTTAWAAARTRLPLPPVQRLVRVTEAVVARSSAFKFLLPTVGLGVLPHAGTAFAQDGEHIWTTPYDNTVLVMPSAAHAKPGNTVVRLGRFEPG